MKDKARVVSVKEKMVTLKHCDSGSCQTCGGKGFCTVTERTFQAFNGEGYTLKPGDMVEIFLPPGKTIWSGFMVLILPLLLFFLLFTFSRDILAIKSEGINALFGLSGIALGFCIAFIGGRVNKIKKLPRITAVLTE